MTALWGKEEKMATRLEMGGPMRPRQSVLLAHAKEPCVDPDCELHHPEVIEDPRSRDSARAWFEAGRQSTERTPLARLDLPFSEFQQVCVICRFVLADDMRANTLISYGGSYITAGDLASSLLGVEPGEEA